MLTMFKLNFYLLIIIISIGLFGRVSYSDEQDTDDGQDEFDGPEEYCSDRDVIEKLKDIILPDDYDSDVPIKQEIRSIDEYKEIFARLQTYKDNASAKADPLRKVLVNNLKDYLLTMPFETKCFQSLTRITEAIQTREKWATKCKLSCQFSCRRHSYPILRGSRLRRQGEVFSNKASKAIPNDS